VARLVEHLARGRQPCIGILEPLGQVGGDDPRPELAPHEHRQRMHERGALLRVELDAAVPRHRLSEYSGPVPSVAVAVGVDASQAARARLGQRQRFVDEGRVGGPGAIAAGARDYGDAQRARNDLREDQREAHAPSFRTRAGSDEAEEQ
jgi:hypothetical protein